MTNTDIVIPRSELPGVWAQVGDNCRSETISIQGAASGLKYRINERASEAARKLAYEQLAIAEAIDCILAELAKAEELESLNAEALALYNALHGLKSETWGRGDDYAKKHWRNVARAARELHGK